MKNKYLLNDPKRRKRRMSLSCSKKIICIITWKSLRVTFIVCIIVLTFLEQKISLSFKQKVCKNKDFCEIVLPTEKKKNVRI